MTFGVLLLIVIAGLAGPLLGAFRRFPVPVAVGEIAAGVIVGGTGLGWLDASDPTVAFLSDVGFAMLMLAAGMHIPIHAVARGHLVGRALGAVAVTAALAVPAGYAAARVIGDGNHLVYTVLLAGGSAALIVPALIELRAADRPAALTAILWISIADIIAIAALPLVLQPDRAGRAALASIAVSAIAAAVFVTARMLDDHRVVTRIRRLSKKRSWALDLRLSLAVLFTLCWVAVEGGTSILVAGFSAGLVVGALGGPHRLSTQVTGVAQGFLVPLFFVARRAHRHRGPRNTAPPPGARRGPRPPQRCRTDDRRGRHAAGRRRRPGRLRAAGPPGGHRDARDPDGTAEPGGRRHDPRRGAHLGADRHRRRADARPRCRADSRHGPTRLGCGTLNH